MIFINPKAERMFGREKLMAVIAAHKPHARSTNPDKTPLTPTRGASQAKPAPSTRQAAAKRQERSSQPQQGTTAAEQRRQEEDKVYAAMWPEKTAQQPLPANEQQTYDRLWGADQGTPLAAADDALHEKLWPKRGNG